jgi:hypothetical protein
MNRVLSVALATIALAIMLPTLSINAQTNGATVQGIVTDSTSAVLPGVKVTATNRDSKASTSTTSDANGKYAFSGLQEGEYAISASLPGFSTHEVDRPIKKDEAVEWNFVLKVGNGRTTVILNGQPHSQGMVIRPNGNFR